LRLYTLQRPDGTLPVWLSKPSQKTNPVAAQEPGVGVPVGVAVAVPVGVGVGVAVAVPVGVGVGVAVAVVVGVGVGVGVPLGVPVAPPAHETPFSVKSPGVSLEPVQVP
jgi:hypothetical protein